MILRTDECVSCPKEIGCLGDSCPNRNVPVLICDRCGEQVDRLRELDGEQLCVECTLEADGSKEVII